MALALDSTQSVLAPIISRHEVGDQAWVIAVKIEGIAENLKPGQFAMLSLGENSPTVIARPFSLYGRPSKNHFTFIVQKMGKGTKALVDAPIGTMLRCLLPLGNGFEVAPVEQDVVMVAGGVGAAPFLMYGQQRIALGASENTHMFFGGRSAQHLFDHQSFDDLDMVMHYSTDDGSQGFKGNVIACLAVELDKKRISNKAIFVACGPEGLLHAFADFARLRKLDAYLSLETYMGCGFGVCNACPVPTSVEGQFGDWPYAKTCTQGPVFALGDIKI
ncbi:MAG: dihydroorotate dehydrogenase electron transfer subunit [Myxococcota bacterium]|jgi:dihydroorotate dehydrogenase electron transfer subunit